KTLRGRYESFSWPRTPWSWPARHPRCRGLCAGACSHSQRAAARRRTGGIDQHEHCQDARPRSDRASPIGRGGMKLADIARLKAARIEGEPGALNFGNHPDISDHIARLRPEFGGQPELCFFNAQLIVHIRRNVDLVENVPAFLGLWAEEAEFLTRHL